MSVPAVSPTGNGLPAVSSSRPEFARLVLALVIVLATALGLALHVQSLLGDSKLGASLMSDGMREQLAHTLRDWAAGGTGRAGIGRRELPLVYLFKRSAVIAVGVWLGGAVLFRIGAGLPLLSGLWRWGVRFLWLGLLGAFEILWASGGLLHSDSAAAWFAYTSSSLVFFHTLAVGGFLTGAITLLCPADRAIGQGWLRRSLRRPGDTGTAGAEQTQSQPAGASPTQPQPPGRGPADLRSGVLRALAHPAVVWLAAAAFASTFAVLSIFQYRALMVPHGDTAMYEEHLWNVLHGKGFRSQLDGGRLFLGEHLEVIHLLLLPIYVLYPCLPTLNVCLSFGLGAGAIAVRGITRKLTGSAGAANWLAVAYLLYFPLQYLNLEASLKTFRPENLGVPLLLFAIWCLETDRLRTMLVLLGLALLAKEDYAVPAGALGLYLAVRRGPTDKRVRLLGLGLFVFALVYLWFVLQVFIPYFRGGPPHYTAYFSELGDTPGEIAGRLIAHPGLLFGRLCTLGNLMFVLMLVLPLGGLPLVGFGRFWVLVPSLVPILLSGLEGTHSPLFHFHAPLVPVVFWAAAEGMGRFAILDFRFWIARPRGGPAGSVVNPQSGDARSDTSIPQATIENQKSKIKNHIACFAAMCALVSGFWSGKSPLSLAFYDPNSGLRGFGLMLYAREERVQQFEKLFPLIPLDASVAATDYVRPRFTHHRECHQYGAGGLKEHIQSESIDYIVVDLTGPYSDWFEGHRLREVVEQPDRWEVLHWDRSGEWFFHVVRAKREGHERTPGPAAAVKTIPPD